MITRIARPVLFACLLMLSASYALAEGPEPPSGLVASGPAGPVTLPALTSRVHLDVTGPLLSGTIRQTFHNLDARVLEAEYVFPLPEGAVVDDFEMRIGDRLVRSVVRERVEAQAAYETARAEGKKAGLLSDDRRGLFRTRVANLNPDEEVSVTLHFLDEAAFRDGVMTFTLPLTWLPRYTASAPGEAERTPIPSTPSSCSDRFIVAAAPAAPEVSLDVNLEAGLPLGTVGSPSHPLVVERTASGTGARVTVPSERLGPDRDFVLEWSFQATAAPRGAVFVEERDDATYALAMLVPPGQGTAGDAAGSPGLPTRTLFVIDVSGSMEGPSLEQARLAVLEALDRLGPHDSFDLVRFSSSSVPYRPFFSYGAPASLDAARQWVRALHTEGGTEILDALQTAAGLLKADRSDLLTRVILITDGAVEADDAAVARLVADLGAARLHVVGIGAAPNRPLLRRLSRLGRGEQAFLSRPEEVGSRMRAFLARVDRPVFADLRLDWDGAPPRDVYPERLPDLHEAEPLFVSLRLDRSHPGTVARLAGWGPAGPVETTLAIAPDAPRGSGIAARWARARIESLFDASTGGAVGDTARTEIVSLAKDLHLVTRFTSLVAIEETPTAAGGPAVAARVPAVLPDGASLGLLPATGTSEPLLRLCGLVCAGAGVVLLALRRLLAG
jgi:Ca-activated chloride channel family protein